MRRASVLAVSLWHITSFAVAFNCQASSKATSPLWWDRDEMMNEFKSFLNVYQHRPFGRIRGGMLMEHSFGFWYILRKLQPKFIIESGVFEGHSTWLARQAVPEALIISIEPAQPKYNYEGKHICLCGNNFTDFDSVQWTEYDVDPAKAVLFFDDHMSNLKRLLQGFFAGFKHFIFEDNYRHYAGDYDSYSLKINCNRSLSGEVRYADNFGKQARTLSNEEHRSLGDILAVLLNEYAEFPPLVPGYYDAVKPLFNRRTLDSLLTLYPEEDFRHFHYGFYNNIAYAKIV